MKRLSNIVGVCFTAALLAACGEANNGLAAAGPTAVAPLIIPPRSAAGSAALPAATATNLYVANNSSTVTVYMAARKTLLQKIRQGVTLRMR